ncbi:hypothetical protein [Propionivibrio dicarboxylicus]|uniref:Uncharacterized protein n=1 Tax=Propionivibrio dicarboxylicus TaxID=83767 RepID=A0A1G7W3Z8_9RHOO|nr:hypothetical protein [Propionivibrio dicarboxylicus]SDG66459.1 hypothetical protein SAMN05660652_00397 [Propionivibrio dicarboxylicus]
MKRSPKRWIIPLGSLFCTSLAFAQVSVSTPGQGVVIQRDGQVSVQAGAFAGGRGKNEASVVVGHIADDANIEGVTVINGRVTIDGKDVPANATRYTSPRTGKVYSIQRNGGSVSVNEIGGGK